MISTTFYVASRLAITGFISVSFFEETVLRSIRSGSRKVSAGLVVSVFKSTIILILAADEAASIYLSNDTSARSAGRHIPDAIPEAHRLLGTACPVCKLHQGLPDRHPPVNFALPVPAQKFFLHSSLSSFSSSPVLDSTPRDIFSALDLPNIAICKRFSTTSDTTLLACDDDRLTDVLLPFHHHLSSPVLKSMAFNITTTLDLPNLATCKRLSVTSDTGSVASSDDSKDTFPNKENYGMPHPEVRASAHITMDDDRVDVPDPSTTIDIISPLCTPYIRPLAPPVSQCQTTPAHITHHSISGSARLTDASLQTTKTDNSLHSSPSVVPDDGSLEGVFIGTDEALSVDTKAIEYHVDALPSYTPALAADDALVIENALPICNALSHPPDVLPLSLLDSFSMLMSTIIDTNPSGSAHPTDTLTHKTKAAASWLKPLILVTKYAAAGRLTPPTALSHQPEKSRPCELKQQKCKPRSSRMNAACHTIMRSHLRRRIFGHLARVCGQIHVDNGDLVNDWVTSMAAVGLTSMLAGNHRTSTSPGSPLPPILDAFSTSEPGSRIKARVISLRHRTNAVAAAIPAITTLPLSPRRRWTS